MKPALMAPAVLAVLSFSTAAIAQPADGEGTFQAAVGYQAGLYPWSIAVGDFNEDATIDLAVASESAAGVSVLLGNGDGTFQEASRASTTP